jgi:hypothetical protein
MYSRQRDGNITCSAGHNSKQRSNLVAQGSGSIGRNWQCSDTPLKEMLGRLAREFSPDRETSIQEVRARLDKKPVSICKEACP